MNSEETLLTKFFANEVCQCVMQFEVHEGVPIMQVQIALRSNK